MAEINGTSDRDVVTVDNWDTFHGLQGDDEIVIVRGTGQGNEGNDTLIGRAVYPWDATVWYWWSPDRILVDLEAGYALDGYGGRDSLINIRNVHGFYRDGDQGFGSGDDDRFYLGSSWELGRILIDGRDGVDTVTMSPAQHDGDPVFTASADGRVVMMHYSSKPDFVFELRNVEQLEVWWQETQSLTAFSVVSLIDPATVGAQTLLAGGKGWQGDTLGQPVALTYSFMTGVPAQGGGEGGSGFVAFDAAQQQVVRDVLAKLQQHSGLTFTEVAAGSGQLQFGINQQAATRGYSFNPSEVGDARAGDVWLDVETAQQLAPGREGHYVLLHEIGHALGLAHPLPESDRSGATVLLDRWYDLGYTIMVDEAQASAWPTWYGAFDLQALRHLYGARQVAVGNDTYRFGDAAGLGLHSLIDDGGIDTIDASAASLGVLLDLRPGRGGSVGLTREGTAAVDNLVVAAGSWIEHAVGSAHDDVLIGNDLGNRLKGGVGNDIVDGQGGIDWALMDGSREAYEVYRSEYGGQWVVAARDGRSGTDELRNVERVAFADAALALDLGPGQSAGQAALLMGAVLGRELMLQKRELMGAVIDLFDQGFTLPALAGALMRLPVWEMLAGGSSATAVATYLHKTVYGQAPTAAALQQAVAALSQQPQGAYLASLATSQANQLHIDLVGLADAGLEFVALSG